MIFFGSTVTFFVFKICTLNVAMMSRRDAIETKQKPSRARSGHQICQLDCLLLKIRLSLNPLSPLSLDVILGAPPTLWLAQLTPWAPRVGWDDVSVMSRHFFSAIIALSSSSSQPPPLRYLGHLSASCAQSTKESPLLSSLRNGLFFALCEII